MFGFLRNCQTVFPWLLHVAVQPACSCCRMPSPACDGVHIPNLGHSDRCAVVWYLVLIFSSVMTCDAEHLFLCLTAIRVSSLMSCLFISFVHPLIGSFVFFFLSFKSSTYTKDTGLLSDVCFKNLFPNLGLAFSFS